MRSCRKYDKLEQWVIDRALKEEVLALMLGRKKKFFSMFHCLCIMDYAYLSVTRKISKQSKAETHLTKIRRLKMLKQ